MKKKKLFLALFITVLYFTSFASAEVIKLVNITDVLYNDNSLFETIHLVINSNYKSEFLFALPFGATNISVNNAPYGDNNTLSIPLSCESCNILISYSIEDVVATDQERNEFTYSRNLNFPGSPLSLEYTIILPEGFIIDQNNNTLESNVVPTPKNIKTDGRNIIINWQHNVPTLPQSYFVRYIPSQPAQDNSASFVSYIPWFFLVLVFGLAIGYLISMLQYRKTSKTGTKDFAIPASLLSPDEKKIIELLRKNNKVMNQKEIVKTLEWSKSKVSAIMTNLDYKKVIERERFGRNYKVKLVKNISD